MDAKRILFLRTDHSACDELSTILHYINYNPITVDHVAFFNSDFDDQQLKMVIIHKGIGEELFSKAVNVFVQAYPQLPIIVFDGCEDDLLDESIDDILTLPISQQQLLRVLHRSQKYQDNKLLSNVRCSVTQKLVGECGAMGQLKDLIARVAMKNVNVLITGESGTGKELAANSIHQLSGRSSGPFVPINCGAIPPELLESELFGHEKGAFTGAITTRKGRFELAQGGTLFLDEIGDMPLAMQVKLLRVLQERKFERIGGAKSIEVDVRVIAATHCDLEQAVEQGLFREDLYYRLNVFPLRMPSLRDRLDDLPLLLTELVERFGDRHQCTLNFTASAISSMQAYAWPGNVRELANLVERCMVIAPNGVIDVTDLPSHIQPSIQDIGVSNFCHSMPDVVDGMDLKQYMYDTELMLIKKALDCSQGVVAQAARLLNIRRTTLVEKMRKYNIKRIEEIEDVEMA